MLGERNLLGSTDLWSDYECRARPPDVTACGSPFEFGETYVYLLGLYLGDGCISAAPKNVFRLRVFQDARYEGLIAECALAICQLTDRAAGRQQRSGCVEIYSAWKHWACLFPQHATGRKHSRSMKLRDWQERLVERYPRALIRGLIHSDGCRSVNRVRRPTRTGVKEYAYVRYYFTNASADIRAIFAAACDLVEIKHRVMTERVISVAQRDSVRRLDEFIGPKS